MNLRTILDQQVSQSQRYATMAFALSEYYDARALELQEVASGEGPEGSNVMVPVSVDDKDIVAAIPVSVYLQALEDEDIIGTEEVIEAFSPLVSDLKLSTDQVDAAIINTYTSAAVYSEVFKTLGETLKDKTIDMSTLVARIQARVPTEALSTMGSELSAICDYSSPDQILSVIGQITDTPDEDGLFPEGSFSSANAIVAAFDILGGVIDTAFSKMLKAGLDIGKLVAGFVAGVKELFSWIMANAFRQLVFDYDINSEAKNVILDYPALCITATPDEWIAMSNQITGEYPNNVRVGYSFHSGYAAITPEQSDLAGLAIGSNPEGNFSYAFSGQGRLGQIMDKDIFQLCINALYTRMGGLDSFGDQRSNCIEWYYNSRVYRMQKEADGDLTMASYLCANVVNFNYDGDASLTGITIDSSTSTNEDVRATLRSMKIGVGTNGTLAFGAVSQSVQTPELYTLATRLMSPLVSRVITESNSHSGSTISDLNAEGRWHGADILSKFAEQREDLFYGSLSELPDAMLAIVVLALYSDVTTREDKESIASMMNERLTICKWNTVNSLHTLDPFTVAGFDTGFDANGLGIDNLWLPYLTSYDLTYLIHAQSDEERGREALSAILAALIAAAAVAATIISIKLVKKRRLKAFKKLQKRNSIHKEAAKAYKADPSPANMKKLEKATRKRMKAVNKYRSLGLTDAAQVANAGAAGSNADSIDNVITILIGE